MLVNPITTPYFLQHLPDFKGIETANLSKPIAAAHLQHLPDFKGIETTCINPI